MQISEPILLYQRRDFSIVLNDAFYFLSQNFFPVSKLILYYAGPVILIESLFLSLFQKEFMNPVDWYAIITYLGFYMLFFLISSAIILSITCNYLLLYQANNHCPIKNISAVIRKAGKDIMRLVFAEIGILVILMLSALFLFIPAVYLIIPASLIWMSMIQEQRGFFSAFNRTLSLIRGFWWRTFGLFIISGLIQGAISFVLQIPAQVLNFMHTFHQAKGEVMEIPEYLVLSGFFLSGLSQFFMIITALIIAFQYYSIVEKKESPDLLARINAMTTEEGDVVA